MKKTSGFQFILGVIVGAVMFGGSVAYAAGIIAQPKTAAIVIDDQTVDLKGYVIEGAHYFQIRDLDATLIPSGKDFSVVWDGAGNRVIIDTSRSYDPNETLPVAATPAPVKPASSITVPDGIFEKDIAIWTDENYEFYENELEVVRLVNEERAKAGLDPVTLSIELCKVARIKAIEMVELGYFAHESPNYGAHTDMVRSFGINCKWAGENAARLGGTNPGAVVYNWMSSEGHKKNILNPKHNEIGVGLAKDGTGLGYWSLFLMY